MYTKEITIYRREEIIKEIEKITKIKSQLKWDILNFQRPIPQNLINLLHHKFINGNTTEEIRLYQDLYYSSMINNGLTKQYEYRMKKAK